MRVKRLFMSVLTLASIVIAVS